MKGKRYRKVRDHCHYTRKYRDAAHSICNLKYRVLKKAPVAFHNGSNYKYHLIIPIEKEVKRIDKNGEEITKNISNIL